MKLYWKSNGVNLYNGSVLEDLPLKPQSVSCCITSPPYWGLRDYGLAPEIWGGDSDCQHEWGNERIIATGRHDCDSELRKGRTPAGNETASTGQFCRLCGAWRGCLGLEPTPELYIEHLIYVFDKVRNVLRDDGTLWVNLGDSYISSGQVNNHQETRIAEILPQVKSDPMDSWAAGFFDGEGNIAIVKNAGREAGKLRITAAQVDKNPIERLQYLFGGSIRKAKANKVKWRDYWVWELSAQKAVDALKRMEPCLIVKKQQAYLAYEFQSTVGDNNKKPRLTDEIIEKRLDIKRQISLLNHNVEDKYKPPKAKDLALIPEHFVIAMQRAGWWVRSTIIWNKPNPMPESCTDRPTTSHDYIYLFTKAARYFYDADAVREEAEYGYSLQSGSFDASIGGKHGSKTVKPGDGMGGRNLRSVWTIATKPFKDAHFATFPPEIPEKCIKAGTPVKICAECGVAWVRVVEKGFTDHDGETDTAYNTGKSSAGRLAKLRQAARAQGGEYVNTTKTLGFRPNCECYDSEYRKMLPRTKHGRKRHQQEAQGEWILRARRRPGKMEWQGNKAIVLDIFGGSGTVAEVANKLGHDAVLIEASTEYCKLAKKRLTFVNQGKLL